jgi:hypothetical protein
MKVPWNDLYIPYLKMANLFQVAKIGYIPLDGICLTALQERWRKETHTFHMAHGEMTITLEDVSCLLGLRVDGMAMCVNNKDVNWGQKITDLLGRTPETGDYRHDSAVLLKRKWFTQNFSNLEVGAPELTVQQYCRAYILALCGDILFTEPSGDSISVIPLVFLEDMERLDEWAWGSAVLGYLYRELCKSTAPNRKNMGGCIMLLQMWAWTRFKFGRPTPRLGFEPDVLHTFEDPNDNYTVGFIWIGATLKEKPGATHLWGNRDQLDNLHESQIEWRPYEKYRTRLPPICEFERDSALIRSKLIYMWIVEHYRPQRVMRQFGLYQKIPPQGKCEYNHILEKMSNGRGDDWPTVHARYVQDWEFEKWQYWTNNSEKFKRRAYNPDRHLKYMEWYGSVSNARLVQSTIPHDTSSYRPLIPDKRKAVCVSI